MRFTLFNTYASSPHLIKQPHLFILRFFVAQGEAVVSRIDQGEIGFLKRGDHFGETALLKQSLRMATVTVCLIFFLFSSFVCFTLLCDRPRLVVWWC
jgi:hypothetical protein